MGSDFLAILVRKTRNKVVPTGEEASREDDWARNATELIVGLFGPENVTSTLYTSAEDDSIVLTCKASPHDLFIDHFKSWNQQRAIQWRLYDPLPVPVAPATTSHAPHILVCVALTPTLDLQDDFNEWYNKEHITLLSQTPTWMSSTRYRLLDSSDDAPLYLAMHKWASRAALNSPEHKIATTTPWRNQVINAVKASERRTYDYVGTIHPTDLQGM